MTDKVCEFLKGDEVKKFVDSMETFIFDCDGVLWNGIGVIDGAVEVLHELRKLGKRVFFVTNNSSKSREDYAKKFENFGIKVSKDEIYGTSYAVAYYLKEILKFDKKVFTIGTTGMIQELDELGIPHTGSGPDLSTGGYNIKEWTNLPLDPEVGAVVCGFDEHFSYHKLIKAASYLAKDTCLFIATNCDDRFPFNSTDIVIPGTGCLVISVEAAARRKAKVVGKPERIMFDCINSRHNIDPSKACMIGDRLNTDILFGNNCGLKTILVLTGISSLEDVKLCQDSNDAHNRDCIPDFYISSIDALRLPLNPSKYVKYQ
ncbi:Glycerol-3-phosphate phosphatase [Acropora cervicornis]|uniref:Glycerol-3-phosphate phosphatase n=1 Tax=Acropora cervicornis TaxID=6130 RepID=A0AAD9R5S8_ACRCE|nr:Glycerol-3-phosphate phosphatase [Acropora cervicornis]